MKHIFNGCGGEGGISFSKLVRHNLEMFPKYDKEKAISFWEGVEDDICKPHDIRFYEGGGLYDYLKANTIFAYDFTLKLWWTAYWVYFLSFPVMFLGLNIFGIRYFYWCFPWNKRKVGTYISNIK